MLPEWIIELGLVVGESIATQLTPGGDRPDIRHHPIVLLEQLLSLKCPGDTDTGGKDLRPPGILPDALEGAGT